MDCLFGPAAKDGDYVLVVKRTGYQGKYVDHYIGRVFKGKVYTGIRDSAVGGNYVHTMSALMLYTAEPGEEVKVRIQRDLAMNNPDDFEMPAYLNLDDFFETHLNFKAEDIEQAFALCKNEEEVDRVCGWLHFGHGGLYGDYTYAPIPGGFEVAVNQGNCHGKLPFEYAQFEWKE